VDVLRDDERGGMCYLFVVTGELLKSRRVLLSTTSFREVDCPTRRFRVALTVNEVKNSPDVNTDEPVSRYHESHCR